MTFPNQPILVCDTEYRMHTLELFWVGLTRDGKTIYGMPWEPKYTQVIKEIMEDVRITKCFHNASADIRVFKKAGVEVQGPIYDTMLGMYVLHPSLNVGLSHAARYYLDDIKYWKDMEHDDPKYNALDVAYTWGVMQAQIEECKRRPVNPMPEIEVRCRLIPVIMAMEDRGLKVDIPCQQRLIKEMQDKAAQLGVDVEEYVKPHWADRVLKEREAVEVIENQWEELRCRLQGQCDKHPKFNGLRAKQPKCPKCIQIWLSADKLREDFTKIKRTRSGMKTRVKKLMEGFNPNSNDHLKWLLYEHLKLPVQKDYKTKRPTSNAQAIDKLSRLKTVQKKKAAFEVVTKIKDAQGCLKAVGTFLDVPVKKGYLRWPDLSYKINGTDTGRLAGGEDKKGDVDKLMAAGHSLMNIPEEWRQIYVPPPGQVFVYADYNNQEGRVQAWLMQDPAYMKMFKEEDAGGHKVHSITAATVFEVDPGDVKRVKLMVKGVEVSAYAAGKMVRHATTYTMTPINFLVKTVGMDLASAIKAYEKLSEMHPGLVVYKQQLVEKVLGKWEVDERRVRPKAMCVEAGTRFYANPFGWQREWYGGGKVLTDIVTKRKVALPVQANKLLNIGPQSIGGSICARVMVEIEPRYPLMASTYDSVMVACPDSPQEIRECGEYVKQMLEQQWEEMRGYRLPVEVKWGRNWGEVSESNPEGLRRL